MILNFLPLTSEEVINRSHYSVKIFPTKRVTVMDFTKFFWEVVCWEDILSGEGVVKRLRNRYRTGGLDIKLNFDSNLFGLKNAVLT
jgi:hypothetical protein